MHHVNAGQKQVTIRQRIMRGNNGSTIVIVTIWKVARMRAGYFRMSLLSTVLSKLPGPSSHTRYHLVYQ